VTTPARFGPRGFLGALLFVVALFVIAKTLAAFAASNR
jgi:hypothetical protein